MNPIAPWGAEARVRVLVIVRRACGTHRAEVASSAVAQAAVLLSIVHVAEWGALPLVTRHIALAELILARALHSHRHGQSRHTHAASHTH